MGERTLSNGIAGRLAGALFLASGAITALSMLAPVPRDFDRLALVTLSAAAALVGVLVLLAPWDRWPRRATLALVPVALALIAIGSALELLLPGTEGVYIIVVFAWVGIAHAPWSAVKVAPLALAAYLIPVVARGEAVAGSAAAAFVVIPVGVLVGETMAWVTERLRRAEDSLRDSERGYARAFEMERAAADRLRSLDNLKNGLVASVSHEIRTPLTSILGLALTLERQGGNLEPERVRGLTREMAKSARKLDALLTDLLDVDRLARGVLEPRRSPADLGALVRAVVDRAEFEDHPVAVDCERIVCPIDVAQVERIVEHLLANALRHTPPGTPVWVRAARAEGGAVISVEDAGRGVPPEWREHVFEPFAQADPMTAHAPGIGVGLTLVERFTELHGGSVSMEDRPGGGTVFRVWLPIGSRDGDRVTLPETRTGRLADAG